MMRLLVAVPLPCDTGQRSEPCAEEKYRGRFWDSTKLASDLAARESGVVNVDVGQSRPERRIERSLGSDCCSPVRGDERRNVRCRGRQIERVVVSSTRCRRKPGERYDDSGGRAWRDATVNMRGTRGAANQSLGGTSFVPRRVPVNWSMTASAGGTASKNMSTTTVRPRSRFIEVSLLPKWRSSGVFPHRPDTASPNG